MSKSKIEWVLNPDGTLGVGWPVVTGCTKCSPGCQRCFAAKLAATRLRNHPHYAGLAVRDGDTYNWTGEVRCNEDELDKPLRWRKPRTVFVSPTGDLFHEDVPDDFIDRALAIAALCSRHTFLLLTKRAERQRDHMKRVGYVDGRAKQIARQMGNPIPSGMVLQWPLPNVVPMVTACNQKEVNENVPILLDTPAVTRGVSIEPMLGPVDLTEIRNPNHFPGCMYTDALRGRDVHEDDDYLATANERLDWVICGGETGPGARPMHPDWARSLRDQCQDASVPFFFKQWGEWMPVAGGGVGMISNNGGSKQRHTFTRWDGSAFVVNDPERVGEYPHDMYRVGKKRAGHLLDGREHRERPEVETDELG